MVVGNKYYGCVFNFRFSIDIFSQWYPSTLMLYIKTKPKKIEYGLFSIQYFKIITLIGLHKQPRGDEKSP
jgi:hypothetical protein